MFKNFRKERLNIFLEFPIGKVQKESTDFGNEGKLFLAPFVHKARHDFGVIIIFNVTAQKHLSLPINSLHALKPISCTTQLEEFKIKKSN